MNNLRVIFKGTGLAVEVDSYSDNGATAIRFVDPWTGEPYLTATTNLTESAGLTPWQFFLKEWSENVGVGQALAAHIHRVGSVTPVSSGFVRCICYEVNEDSPLYDMIADQGGTPVSTAQAPSAATPLPDPLFTPATPDAAVPERAPRKSAEKAEPTDGK